MANDKRGAGKPAPQVFSAADALRILAQEPGRPSGVIVHIGGYDVNLHPFTTEEGSAFFDILSRTGDFQEKLAGGSATEVDFMRVISNEGKIVTGILKSLLSNSLAVKDAEGERAAFDAWFGRQPLVPMVKALMPAVVEANGFGAMMRKNPPDAPKAEEPEAQPNPSTRPQLSGVS
jgi:hypothetical protein